MGPTVAGRTPEDQRQHALPLERGPLGISEWSPIGSRRIGVCPADRGSGFDPPGSAAFPLEAMAAALGVEPGALTGSAGGSPARLGTNQGKPAGTPALPVARLALKTLTQRGLLRRAESDHWQFTHVLGYRFARDEDASDPAQRQLLGRWLHAHLMATLKASAGGETVLPLARPLEHAAALLRADHDQQLWRPLAEDLLYDARDRLVDLGRLELVKLALRTVADWMERFPPGKAAEPDWQRERSSMLDRQGDVLSAQGDLATALQDMAEATRKPAFRAELAPTLQAVEELNQSAGRAADEAKVAAFQACAQVPHLAQMRELAKVMQTTAQQYRQQGDTASTESLAGMGLMLGSHLSAGGGSQTLINQLVGIAIEKMFLQQLDPQGQDSFGRPVAEVSAAIAEHQSTIKGFAQTLSSLTAQLGDAEWATYMERVKLNGEEAALTWLKTRHASP